ncbi:hypothetical protein FB567DRAFT_614001 [Paraphoma chrysanthemicola]|uniref:NAD(P)-binding domain-containing protein n=1 Tax=Paraphoma chrysanthemicola TaxID=798071 RepID=A0A8K0W2M0_9PLEO|nr:hypothetical protein FB567DRAFT_614001 [Paraphoma chrysanthemicola]
MVTLFFLGATGHIGGAVLNAIHTRFPDIEIVALVRDVQKANRLSERGKHLRAVVGDFRDLDSIEGQAKASDIVINTSPDLLPGSDGAICAALSGLSSSPRRGFYIQTSGAFLIGEDAGGASSEKVWSDIEDIDAIVAMPSTRHHQRTDQIVRDFSSTVNISIVSPSVVYGLSSSTGNPVPITVRDIVAAVNKLSMGFVLGQGNNILGYIDIEDLADIYVRLVDDAVKGPAQHDPRLWGPQAYYFANGEEISFATYMKELVGVLQTQGILRTNTIIDARGVTDMAGREAVNITTASHGCGMNVRCRSKRAETLLLWKAKGPGLLETLPEVVDVLLSQDTP